MGHQRFLSTLRSPLNTKDTSVEQLSLWLIGGLFLLFATFQVPELLALLAIALAFHLRFPGVVRSLTNHPLFHRSGGWKTIGVIAGVLLFVGITGHTEPATAQLFNTAEQQAQNIFGQYLDQSIIGFLFGMLRIVVWVSAVGFIFFAVYQAQRGEQWQPLLQNAFIIIAAVVVVEGLSRLFFGRA
jgi:hypothetical protein